MSDISLIPQNLIKNLESDLNGKTNEEWVNSRIIEIMNSSVWNLIIAESETNYIKLKNGLLVQWGIVKLNGQITEFNKKITFPKPFTTIPKTFAAADANVSDVCYVGWQTTTNMTVGIRESLSNIGSTSWIAIGY